MVLDDLLSRVADSPDAIAVQDGDQRLTYQELAAHASALAARLVRRGVGPDDVVAVYADRSAELVVAELAVLLAGGGYLPLDPAHPAARTRELIALSGAVAVITAAASQSAGLDEDSEVVDLATRPVGSLPAPVSAADTALAYVIFTSGSTGRPKGVAVTRGNLAYLMRWREHAYQLSRHDRTTLLCSPGFDASIWDIWPTLASGGTLVVPPATVRASPRDLVAWLADEQITATFLPTPLGEAVLGEQWPARTALRLMHTGGAALLRGMPAGLPFTLINLYGPTETTVGVTTIPVLPGGPVPPPIGFPAEGVRCYVLDGLSPVPEGEAGEMFLGGACVARGYLGDPAATARSFLPDLVVPGERMYRTGDRVRRLADGSFEYLGRLDDQVKIRGFRIEPGEVAAVLREHRAVSESFVAVERPERGDPRLIAYVAARATPAELIAFTAGRLPGYMVPAAIVVLPALPKGPSGKLDRAALPAPDRTAGGLSEVAAAGRTPTESALAGVMGRLLGQDRVGADDDFFALGGTSLLVGRLAARIATGFQAAVGLGDLFRARTVAAIASLIDSRGGQGQQPSAAEPPARPPLRKVPRDGPIPLSSQQERVWFFEQFSPGNLAYNFQATVSLRGEVSAEVLRAALDEIIRRHEILRTAIIAVDGVAIQQPVSEARAPLRVLDVAADAADQVIAAELRQPFDLTSPPLARWVLLRHGGGENTLIHLEHHFVHDGWSLGVLLAELSALYEAFAARRSPLPEVRIQYADYTRWQRDWMRGEVLKAHVDHWTGLLAGAPEVLELPADRPRPPVLSLRGAAPRITVPGELSRALRSFSREHRVSLFSTMYAGFAALLHRYTGQEDLLVGTGAANRGLAELEPMIGMLVNTVILRTAITGALSFTDLLAQVQRTVADGLAWSDTPVDAVIDAIGPARDPSRTPLFQVMFSFHDSSVPDLRFGGLTGAVTERANGSAKVDLNVIVVPRAAQRIGRAPSAEDDDLSLIWEHSTDLFDNETMSRMVTHYLNLLAGAVARPWTEIGALALLTESQAREVEAWSQGPAVPESAAAGEGATIGGLFARQVARDPGAVAVEAPDGEPLSYGELDRRSNTLAWALRRRGVSTDVPVGVAIERGTELMVALLAVVKAGGAYVAIDSGSPQPRVAAMMAGAGVRLMLVTAQTPASVLGLPEVTAIRVEAGASDTGDEQVPPPDVAHPLSLAYLSFTSGSTGVPKGVAVPHRAVIRLITDPSFVSLGPGERLSQLAPVAFDASTLEIWGALLTGATVVLPPPGPLGLPDLTALLHGRAVTVAWLTTGLFHQLAETDLNALATVPALLTGGEVINPDLVRAVLRVRAGRPLVHAYGPTENTTFTTCHVLTDAGQAGEPVSIGRPIQGTSTHILDARGRPVPSGVPGELFCGGAGVARGYLGNAAATAGAFVPDPSGTGARLYRTGDLARWRADGTIEFVGRVDDQVKIRGFRVEPGEAATVLREHQAVSDAIVVVAGQGAQRHLIGYVTPADGFDSASVPVLELREFAAARLPDYLVPAGFAVLDQFPLKANGKIDRAALPAPAPAARMAPAAPPRGSTEERLAEVWRTLLPAGNVRAQDVVGRDDSFFAVGGNSLLAARLMFRIREVFGADLKMASFYEAPTLAASAAAIDAAGGGDGARTLAAPGIARRDRSAHRVGKVQPGIGRRDRSAYRKTTGSLAAGSPELAPHLVRLTDDWSVWRTMCLRAPGFGAGLLAALGDADLALAADAVLAAGEEARAAYAAEFGLAVPRLSVALHEAARLPELREAIAWQNRHALTTGIDVLIRRGPEPVKRNAKHRLHEALIVSYLQRYCAKNDTIGFFGPMSWAWIDDEPGIRITHAAPRFSLSERITYLEGWAVRAIMVPYAAALRPWLVPRRMPFVGLDGTLLRLPLAPPVRLSPAQAAVLRAVDGSRDASEVAAVVLAEPGTGLREVTDVFAVLGRLADSHRVAWQVDIAPQDTRPECSMRTLLRRVTDDALREPALAALAELSSARDRLAEAAGDAEQVASAMADLESTFTSLAGVPPTRRAGELYAGRTLVYEECLRGDTVRMGAAALDGIREPLALVLDSARWYMATIGAVYAKVFDEAYRQRAAELGTEVVPFTDFWLIVNESLFSQPPRLIEPVVDEVGARWAAVMNVPEGVRRVQLRSADLRERVAQAFPLLPLPWPMAVHHSPDLMIAGATRRLAAGLTWVLGEVHPSIVTSRYATWMKFHDDPDGVRTAMRHDLGRPAVWLAETAEDGGVCSRLSNVLPSADDLRLVYAHDSCGYDPAATLTVGDCELISSPSGLRLRRRGGGFEGDLLEVLGDLVCAVGANSFDLIPPGEHTPRVTIDDLVVSRERWTMAATDPPFAQIQDESERYLKARAWVARHGLPRHVFLRFTGERKPIYADLTSLASIDLIARSLRRCRRNGGADATVAVVEMLPALDEAWLTDAQGQRYTAELRIVAVDQKKQEG